MKHTTAKKKPTRKATAKRPTSRHVVKKAVRAKQPRHVRLVLHPFSLFFLLCAGVLIVGQTYRVLAATIISSKIQAAGLTSAATIATPTDRNTVSTPSIRVTGNCPTDSYVKLSVNDSFGGVSWCDNSQQYAIAATLYSNLNTLAVQAYNITDMPGPATDAITVTYAAPSGSTTPSTSSSSSYNAPTTSTSSDQGSASTGSVTNATGDADHPLLLSSDFTFHSFIATKTFSWTVDLEGGNPPYIVNIDWGDKQTSHLTFPGDPVFTIKHSYDKPGYYPVVVKSWDKTGSQHVMQLAALITSAAGDASSFLSNTAGTSGTQTIDNTIQARSTAATKWLVVAWPSYLIVLLMATSFWLGERREVAFVHAMRLKHQRR